MQDARGDQCDKCSNLLNPTDLVNPRCKLTGTTPVLRSTKHIFLDLPKLSPQLQAYITSASNKGGWSNNCVQVRRHCIWLQANGRAGRALPVLFVIVVAIFTLNKHVQNCRQKSEWCDDAGCALPVFWFSLHFSVNTHTHKCTG